MHETGQNDFVTTGCNPSVSSESVDQVALAICLTKPPGLYASLKVYMTDFFLFARLNLPNVLISVAKIFFR